MFSPDRTNYLQILTTLTIATILIYLFITADLNETVNDLACTVLRETGIEYIPDNYTLSIRATLLGYKSLVLPKEYKLARPFVRMFRMTRIAPKYHLQLCLAQKAMCTIMQNLFCYLYDTEGWVKDNRSLSKEFWPGRFCLERNEIYGAKNVKLAYPHIPYTLFLVRDPIARFISAFMNKCVDEKYNCFGCGTDLLCVVEKFHETTMSLNSNFSDVTNPRTYAPNYEMEHFAPALWLCEMYDDVDKFIFVKYGEKPEEINEMFEKIYDVFRAHGVEQHKIEYMRSQLNDKTRTSHATNGRNDRQNFTNQLMTSRRHLDILNDIYYFDQKAFGFEPA